MFKAEFADKQDLIGNQVRILDSPAAVSSIIPAPKTEATENGVITH